MSSSEVVPGRYDGKVAVVTGGASGIGLATVRRLVAEGASVVIGDLNEAGMKAAAEDLGGRVATIRCDVVEESDIEALVALAVERFGRLDAGFNVAGTAKPGLIAEQEIDDWKFTVDLCLTGVFLAMKHESKQMLSQGEPGAVVNVSSLNSVVPMFGGASYVAAKAGVVMLTQNAALEWGAAGLRANAVSPGLTATPLTKSMMEIEGATEAYLERIPMGQVGTPEQMASACTYLGSDDASYISGVNLVVDGAWNTSGYPDLRPFLARMAASL